MAAHNPENEDDVDQCCNLSLSWVNTQCNNPDNPVHWIAWVATLDVDPRERKIATLKTNISSLCFVISVVDTVDSGHLGRFAFCVDARDWETSTLWIHWKPVELAATQHKVLIKEIVHISLWIVVVFVESSSHCGQKTDVQWRRCKR